MIMNLILIDFFAVCSVYVVIVNGWICCYILLLSFEHECFMENVKHRKITFPMNKFEY